MRRLLPSRETLRVMSIVLVTALVAFLIIRALRYLF